MIQITRQISIATLRFPIPTFRLIRTFQRTGLSARLASTFLSPNTAAIPSPIRR